MESYFPKFPKILTQPWCVTICSTDVSHDFAWWCGSRQHLDCCQFDCQISLICQGIWVLSYSQSADFIVLKFSTNQLRKLSKLK